MPGKNDDSNDNDEDEGKKYVDKKERTIKCLSVHIVNCGMG